MNISVIIPTYNRKDFLKSCLRSLFNQTYPKDKYEIIVIDDGSTDGTRKMIKEFKFKNFRYFYQKNQGQATARNLGIKYAKGKISAFTDDDCVAHQDWLTEIARGFKDKKNAAIGGQIRAHRLCNLIEKYSDIFYFRPKDGINKFYPPSLITANCAYRTRVLKKVGLFDESLKCLEDLDLGWRTYFLGYRFLYVPSAIIYHRMPSNLKQLLVKYFLYGQGKVLVIHKHQNKLQNQHCYLIKIKDFIINDLIKWIFLLPKSSQKITFNCPELLFYYKKERFFYLLLLFLEKLTYRSYRLGMLYQILKIKTEKP